jgi:subtilase family serine protease
MQTFRIRSYEELMKRPRGAIGVTALAVTALTVTALTAPGAGPVAHASGLPAAKPAGFATLPDSAAPFAAASRVTGSVPASSTLTLQFWLAPRTAAAESYVTAAAIPGSPSFRQYLSPAGYAARFGPPAAAAAGVETWLMSAGFTGVSADPGRDYVQAAAPVATIDAALKVRLDYYRATGAASAGSYPLRANDRPVSIPAALAGSVLGVTGLDNAAPVMTYASMRHPATAGVPGAAGPAASPGPAFPCSQWYLQHIATGLPKLYGATRFPTVPCGYTPQQLRRAYGYSAVNDGKGVTVALVEVGLTPDMLTTLRDYARVHGIQAPSAQRYRELSLGRGSACGDPFNVEEQLDVEASYDLAPMANQLVVGGDSCDNGFSGLQALYDADLAVLNGAGGHPLARVVSNSWEGDDETIPANLLQIEHAYLVRAAAEGVTMLFSAGDTSGVEVPASDPYATAVGGTSLGIGHDNPRLFETGWSTGYSVASGGKWDFQGEQGAGGGGASLLWRQPGYQRGVVPSALATATGNRGGLVRAVPDISADADPFTPMAVGMLTLSTAGKVTGYYEQALGGTSLAAPLVAAIVADAEQGQRSFGFLNPALYKLARTSAFNDAKPLSAATPSKYRGVACDEGMCGLLTMTTFDDQSWSMEGYTGQVTAPGYDTMTGLGTPDGQKFINALRRL